MGGNLAKSSFGAVNGQTLEVLNTYLISLLEEEEREREEREARRKKNEQKTEQ